MALRLIFRIFSFGLLLFPLCTARAQWTTPTIDGAISPAGEYGSNNQLNNAGNTGQTWYMTWDATNLYVGITNPNLSEGAVIYVTPNPLNPPRTGTNATGHLTPFNFHADHFPPLPSPP